MSMNNPKFENPEVPLKLDDYEIVEKEFDWSLQRDGLQYFVIDKETVPGPAHARVLELLSDIFGHMIILHNQAMLFGMWYGETKAQRKMREALGINK